LNDAIGIVGAGEGGGDDYEENEGAMEAHGSFQVSQN
jgi:hypothetical protein